MNTLRFAKFSPERREKYRLVPEIWEDACGNPMVRKVPAGSEACEHLASLPEKQALLERLYGPAVCINRCALCEDGTLAIEYVDGTSMEQTLDELFRTKGFEAAAEAFLAQLNWMIPEEKLEKFVPSEDFAFWFGEDVAAHPGWMSLPVSNLDMIPANLIRRGSEQVMLDYEWTFAFPVPADYLRYRIVFYYFFRHAAKLSVTDRAAFYKRFGIRSRELPIWQKMEENFQKRILNAVEEKTAGKEDQALPDGGPGSAQGSAHRLQIYWNQGEGWGEEDSCLYDMPEREIQLRIEIPEGTAALRIDPGDVPCICEFSELSIEENGQKRGFELAANGIMADDRCFLFIESDPNIYITPVQAAGDAAAQEGAGSPADFGGMTLCIGLRTWGNRAEAARAAAERINALRNRIERIESSRAYRLYRMIKGKPKD